MKRVLSVLLALGATKVDAAWDAADDADDTALPLDPYTMRVIAREILDEAMEQEDAAGGASLLPGLMRALELVYEIQDDET